MVIILTSFLLRGVVVVFVGLVFRGVGGFFGTIKMLASDLTVASVVKAKSHFLWHCQSLRGCFLRNECLGGVAGQVTGQGWTYVGLASWLFIDQPSGKLLQSLCALCHDPRTFEC